MFILSSGSSGLEFWSLNHTSIYENAELKDFTSIKCLGKTSNNWPTKRFIKNKWIQDSRIMLIIIVGNITVD